MLSKLLVLTHNQRCSVCATRKHPEPIRWRGPLDDLCEISWNTKKGDLITWCVTFSHMLISGNHLGLEPGDCTSLVKGLGWFELMALPNVHRNLTVPTPADSVLVYVLWLLASKMHNLIWRKVAMHTSLSPMKLHNISSPPSMCYHTDIQNVEGCTMYRLGVRKCSVCALAAWGKALELRQREGSLPVAALLFMCSFAATKTGRLKKNLGASHVTSGSTTMILPISFESKLCSRQSRHQSLNTWNDTTSQWNGHWQAEGRSCGTRKSLCYSTDGSQESHTWS